MQIAVGAKLRVSAWCADTHASAASARFAAEALLKLQRSPIFRRGRMGHLRPLVITSAGLNVVRTVDKRAEIIAGVIQQTVHSPQSSG